MICKKCAKCCIEKTIALSDDDIKKIQTHISTSFFRIRNTGSKVMNWKECKDRQICVFLNPENYLCNIYKYRPKVCKEYICDELIEEGEKICHKNLIDV